VFTTYLLPGPASGNPLAFGIGPDGAVWVKELLNSGFTPDKLVRVNPSDGTMTVLDLPQSNDFFWSYFDNLTAGSDGNLYLSTSAADSSDPVDVVVLTTSATIVREVDGRPVNAMTLGPDGNIWLTEAKNTLPFAGYLDRLAPDGTVTELPSRPVRRPRPCRSGSPLVPTATSGSRPPSAMTIRFSVRSRPTARSASSPTPITSTNRRRS
jgi:hypothetical protein